MSPASENCPETRSYVLTFAAQDLRGLGFFTDCSHLCWCHVARRKPGGSTKLSRHRRLPAILRLGRRHRPPVPVPASGHGGARTPSPQCAPMPLRSAPAGVVIARRPNKSPRRKPHSGCHRGRRAEPTVWFGWRRPCCRSELTGGLARRAGPSSATHQRAGPRREPAEENGVERTRDTVTSPRSHGPPSFPATCAPRPTTGPTGFLRLNLEEPWTAAQQRVERRRGEPGARLAPDSGGGCSERPGIPPPGQGARTGSLGPPQKGPGPAGAPSPLPAPARGLPPAGTGRGPQTPLAEAAAGGARVGRPPRRTRGWR